MVLAEISRRKFLVTAGVLLLRTMHSAQPEALRNL
jgi:hypothetical protein